ncbi:TD and POZ domain-containing protein 2 [Argiope bruennichi]|uniref:TD and POZ domain-containing protein 2 n=1 Tax=Argiope bruennichi TaxID=94029 RepID=A0A8T0FEY9_ARGBR|nr:TD and POZ domain-containing protein 2 [Argiope bruennichi]
MKDGGPSEVHYSIYCKVFIGHKKSNDVEIKTHPSVDKCFSEGSALEFRLLSISDIKRSVGAYTSTSSIKLILKIRLQRKLYRSSRMNSFSVVSESEPWTSTTLHCLPNHLYRGKEKESTSEGGSGEVEDCPVNVPNGIIANYLIANRRSGESNGWHAFVFQINQLHAWYKCHLHFLDIDSQIYASSEPQIFESRSQSIEYPICVMQREDVEMEKKFLSRNGELNVYWNYAGFGELQHVSWKWTSLPHRNVANIRDDLKRLFLKCSNGNLEIRADGEVLKVHRGIIGARWPVSRICRATDRKIINVIDIEEMDSATLKNFLTYIYSGTLENFVEWEDICNLYVAADKYFVRSLRHICSRQLSTRISMENSEHLLTLSHFFEDKELQIAVTNFNRFHSNNGNSSDECKYQDDVLPSQIFIPP